MSEDIKLHKSWRHWCKKAGFRTEGFQSNNMAQWAWFSMRGKGRRWRVNCHNQLSVSLSEEHFDRWALSLVEDAPMPTTEAEFMATVARLNAVAKEADRQRAIYLAS